MAASRAAVKALAILPSATAVEKSALFLLVPSLVPFVDNVRHEAWVALAVELERAENGVEFPAVERFLDLCRIGRVRLFGCALPGLDCRIGVKHVAFGVDVLCLISLYGIGRRRVLARIGREGQK